MTKNPILLLPLILASLAAQAQSEKSILLGDWVSHGQPETRTLTLSEKGKGEFLSEHPQGRCFAPLDAVVDGQFVMAAGTAQNCQQRDNTVAFEFYCQQTSTNLLRCKIHSKHQKSGNIIQGIEDFKRM